MTPRRTTGTANNRPITLLDVLPAPCDAHTDPESRLLVREQLSSVLHALPTLTASEHTALAGTLSGHSYQQMAPAPFGTWKAAEHAAFRARRKLEAALAAQPDGART